MQGPRGAGLRHTTPTTAMSDGEWVACPDTPERDRTRGATPESEWQSPLRPAKARRGTSPADPDHGGAWVPVAAAACHALGKLCKNSSRFKNESFLFLDNNVPHGLVS